VAPLFDRLHESKDSEHDTAIHRSTSLSDSASVLESDADWDDTTLLLSNKGKE